MKLLGYKQILSLYQLSQSQELLLQATVLQGQPALNAWSQWQSMVDIDNLDSGSNALLSRLYSNLLTNHVEHFHMARLKGIYKRHWYGNQLALKKLEKTVRALQIAEVNSLVLGDAATALSYESESQQPSIYDYQLLISSADKEKAIACLEKDSWEIASQAQSKNYDCNFNVCLQDRAGTKLNLQEQLFWAVPQEYTTEQLWAQAVNSRLGNSEVLRLNLRHLFLHLCLRAFYRTPNQQISLFVDAINLLRQQECELDWIELIAQAQRYQLILPLRNMLTLLEQLFEHPLPDWVLAALHQMPVGSKEFLQYQILPQRKRTILKSILLRTVNASSLITS